MYKILRVSVVIFILFSFSSCAEKMAANENNPRLNNKLRLAIMDNDLRATERYLRRGANPDILVEGKQNSVLHWAVYKNNIDLFKLLIEYGANYKATDVDGYYPLTIAAMMDRQEIAAYLIDLGVDVNAINKDRFKSTALMEAAKMNNTEILQLLIDSGANLNDKDIWKYTAIQCAVVQGQYDAVVLLAEAGAELNNTTLTQQMNSLDFAIRRDDREIIDYLISKGAEPNSWGQYLEEE